MTSIIEQHPEAIWWIGSLSGIIFLGSLVLVPWLVVRIPHDYFVTERRPKLPFADRHPAIRWTLLVVKNLLGALLVAAGIAMLVLPGQGLLTIVVGVLLLDFPGKYELEARVIRIPSLRKTVNWLREKRNAKPLRVK